MVVIYQSQLQQAGFEVGYLLKGTTPPKISRALAKQISPKWAIDPTNVHRFRYWNGMRWTPHVLP